MPHINFLVRGIVHSKDNYLLNKSIVNLIILSKKNINNFDVLTSWVRHILFWRFSCMSEHIFPQHIFSTSELFDSTIRSFRYVREFLLRLFVIFVNIDFSKQRTLTPHILHFCILMTFSENIGMNFVTIFLIFTNIIFYKQRTLTLQNHNFRYSESIFSYFQE